MMLTSRACCQHSGGEAVALAVHESAKVGFCVRRLAQPCRACGVGRVGRYNELTVGISPDLLRDDTCAHTRG